jgi:hypothetical protein
MNDQDERTVNEAAYRRLKEVIRQTYPRGRFVALAGGDVIADAGSIEDLHAALEALGKDPLKALIVQAGIDYPEYVVILGQERRP